MYTIAFFAALRVGEITSRAHQPCQNIMAIIHRVFLKTREGTVSVIKHLGITSIVTRLIQ